MEKEKKQKGKMDTQVMMEMYKRLATPGVPHQRLANLTGSWNTKTRGWAEPNNPPMESTGSCEQKMLLRGRFLHQEYTGEMMGSPFTGIGVTGYDNHSMKFVSTWMDSMGTGILFFEGTASADGKTITQESRHHDAVRGPMTWRSVTKIVDDNAYLFELYNIDKRGKEEKMMEITYTRKKG